MNALTVGLVVLSALVHAVRNLLTKKAEDKQVFVWWYELVALGLYLPFFLFFLHGEGIRIPAALYPGMASGFVHFLYWLFLSKSYDQGDLSRVYPIMRSSPAFVLVFSIFVLGEEVSIFGILGILAVVIGLLTINMQKMRISSLLPAINSIAEDESTRYAFLTLSTVTAYSIIDKWGVDLAHPIIHHYLLMFFGFSFFTPYILHAKERSLILIEWKKSSNLIVANSFFTVLSYSLILISFTMERVSYIVGLRQLSVVFGVLLGSYVLREEHRLTRFSAATLIFLGAFLIAIAE